MAFNFSNLQPEKKGKKLVDPIELFQSRRITDSSINDLWLAQGDALRSWNQNRALRDIAVSLNTGAGKTLVGLLMAQSMVNETRGLVLYVCSSIQLVLQTEAKAVGYGLPITTYHGGEFSNDLATSGEAACITTYQALFNGRSIFANREIAGIIFDDAHAAEHLLRDHYTLQLKRETFPQLYGELTALFRDYFHKAGKVSSFDEMVEGRMAKLMLVHPAETRGLHSAILAALRNAKVEQDKSTLFAWSHLKDHIDLCAVLVSGEGITITSPFIPVRTMPYFARRDTRRIYLSATFTGEDAFIRTFGRRADLTIAPTTTAGECERMILVPSFIVGVSDDRGFAEQVIASRKALILTPSGGRAKLWAKIATATRENVAGGIEDFKKANPPEKLLLTARYDGVDLPGDTCRLVVIDELPTGIGPLERFLWEYLGLTSMLRTAVASRVVQSFGRISRGMSDHGVAILTGKRLIGWLRVPRNREILPRFLQKQLMLGSSMSSGMKPDDLTGAIDSCLQRDPEWVNAYKNYMSQTDSEDPVPPAAVLAELATAEMRFAEAMWKREYSAATAVLQETLEASSRYSPAWHGWHKLWVGFAFDCSGDTSAAATLYRHAFATLVNLPRPIGLAREAAFPDQVINAALNFDQLADGRIRVPKNLEKDLAALKENGTPPQVEEALRKLGQYLGLASSRPDQEHGTGPDVLWVTSGIAFCADAKTDKKLTSAYTKDEIGQLADHVQWTRQNNDDIDVLPVLIGPAYLGCTESSNPAPEMRGTELAQFANIAQSLIGAYRDIAATALPLNLTGTVAGQFGKRGLLWADVLPALNLKQLTRAKGIADEK
jgi:hypothetical protein